MDNSDNRQNYVNGPLNGKPENTMIQLPELKSFKRRSSSTETSTINGSTHKSIHSKTEPTDDDEDLPEYIDEEITGPMRYIAVAQEGMNEWIKANQTLINYAILIAIVIGYHVFLGFAIHHNFPKAETMTIFTGLAWVMFAYYYVITPLLGDWIYNTLFQPTFKVLQRFWNFMIIRILFYLLIIGAIAVFLAFDTKDDRNRLMGLVGMAFFVCFMFVFSHNPLKINWRPVAWGFFLQFILGLLVLRWNWGKAKFERAAHYIVVFLDYTNNGTQFVYGFLSAPPNICGMDPVFAFSSIQVVIYFGSIVALLYYYGIMQIVLKKMAWFMQITLGTTATESLNACACIFLGQSEAPLLIKPYLEKMTASELHAIMTSGFSCIAGSLFAAYISFGACPAYLLSSTVMSAPGSLACSKILYPETKRSQLTKIEDLELPKGEETSPLECISNGAVMAVELVLAIIANLIVFLALLAFLDNIIAFAGELLGYEGWTFELIIGYIFYPLAYIMGVNQNSKDTLNVAKLMGTKTALNEFIAYQKLGQMVVDGQLTPRAAMIATYALCGFSNFSSIGIQLGILGGMAPGKKSLLAKIALRALMAGCISCFMTASLAGILVESPLKCAPLNGDGQCFNITLFQEIEANLTSLHNFSTTALPFTTPHFSLKSEL
uniref:Sodium/nucleoside cotransporter n=1 Tax=Acrobeloides nanus TaxID=290746 RepID=A0A914C4R2_9BILA